MIKKLLFFMLFVISLTVYGQSTNYAVLAKTTQPLAIRGNQGELIAAQHQISIGNGGFSKYTNVTSQTIIDYDFWYLTNDANLIHYDGYDGSPNNSCRDGYIVPWNLSTVPDYYINGCIAYSEIMGIYLPLPGVDDSRCIDDIIDLSYGWNWQYSYDGTSWVDFSGQFQEQRTISFKIKDLGGYDGKSQIFFRTGYQTKFTGSISYNIIPCSPEVAGTSDPNLTSCVYIKDGEVTVNLKRDLKAGEGYAEKTLKNTAGATIDFTFKEISASQFSLSGLAVGSYVFSFQTKINVNAKEYYSTPAKASFTITAPEELKFGITYLDPKCNGADGLITITASGGTLPYSYILNSLDEKNKIPFDSSNPNAKSTTIPKPDGTYTIKVIDYYTCQEQKK